VPDDAGRLVVDLLGVHRHHGERQFAGVLCPAGCRVALVGVDEHGLETQELQGSTEEHAGGGLAGASFQVGYRHD
jgi:hypothetical protein